MNRSNLWSPKTTNLLKQQIPTIFESSDELNKINLQRIKLKEAPKNFLFNKINEANELFKKDCNLIFPLILFESGDDDLIDTGFNFQKFFFVENDDNDLKLFLMEMNKKLRELAQHNHENSYFKILCYADCYCLDLVVNI